MADWRNEKIWAQFIIWVANNYPYGNQDPNHMINASNFVDDKRAAFAVLTAVGYTSSRITEFEILWCTHLRTTGMSAFEVASLTFT